ncbi:SH3 domain-containing protein [Luteimonas gilva]|uniref:SH3 domain-containing protein n=1 Tax=Luteimonas gilva TaxID=2572684 RepID=A0A4U5JUM3_9GAMM|nr:SH3 domain-containing protein [Luteimonas gilva]TKR33245.1 SH3 domain-containing protein [Luteimonas gilva]
MAFRGMSGWLAAALCFAGIADAAAAGPVDCAAISRRIAANAPDYRPAPSGKVVGKGRAYFHAAPHASCVRKGFVVAGDPLEVRLVMPGWVQVVFIGKNDGKQYGGWLKQARVELDSVPSLYTGELPADAAAFVKRREECEHFLGEEPYDAARKAYLDKAIRQTCAGGNRRLRELRAKYRNDAPVLYALSGYEDLAE